ncbi:hypothetical protein D5125_17315 [Magnetovirga frankeli]|uniref:hypothetical protein n=1 Tax=Magnetovirga frankeli TaxID=947516 RepID=UPI001293B9F3|nr:hypothetical protein D5125_17315 [gamma proteobacterium SS-5]
MHSLIKEAINNINKIDYPCLLSFIENNIKDKTVVIYGAGAFGQQTANLLKIHKIIPDKFLDINPKSFINEIPTIHPQKYNKKIQQLYCQLL